MQQIWTLYSRQLRIAGHIKYVGMLQLQSTNQGTDYSLVFGIHNRESLEKMKDIFWDMDPRNGSTFIALPPNQPHLILPEPDYASLARELRSVFRGKTLDMCELKEYVLATTRFRSKDIEHALKLLVQAMQISIISNINTKNNACIEQDILSFL